MKTPGPLSLREFNLTCLEVPESNKIDHFAPHFRPAASILSSDLAPIFNYFQAFLNCKKLPVPPLGGYVRIVLGHHISKNLLLWRF